MIGGAKGIGIGIDFGLPNLYRKPSGKPFIEPDVLASLRVVTMAYGKKNSDSDRAIIKNLVDPDNPFIISNAAFKLNSGFGKYEVDFLDYSTVSNVISITRTSDKISATNNDKINQMFLYKSIADSSKPNTPAFKIKISNLTGGIRYYYIDESDTTKRTNINITSDGVYDLPESKNTLFNGTASVNIGFGINVGGSVTIEQIPSYQGAFVTDGVNDLITSTKTVSEMGVTDEITVVSMIHQISITDTYSTTNNLRTPSRIIGRNTVLDDNKTGIYGWSKTNINSGSINTINNILGDKSDYSSSTSVDNWNSSSKFYIEGYINSENSIVESSSVAWYWTVIANKVLTTDQINQVIAYYNLDRCVEPTVLYDVKRQGLSNDTPDSDWYLKDFSKNGFDMSLFNFAKDGNSGVGQYNYPNWKVTATVANTYHTIVNYPTVNGTYSINISGVSEMMQSIGMHLEVKYTTPNEIIYKDIKQDGVYSYILPDEATDLILRFGGIPGIVNKPCNIIITQIPSHAGALCFDGVNDFGKVTGLPIYKDYTVVTDREIFSYIGAISSKNNPGAFMETAGNNVYSFGQGNSGLKFISTRSISYLSKYSYCGQPVTAGTAEDGTNMWLGTIRDNDTRFFNGAIYSLMTFPYSMSEFLIERQLKKHKLDTLYPDMVEFRPIVKSNVEWNTIEIWQADKPLYRPAIGTNETGTYLQKNSTIGIYVKQKNVDEVTKIVVNSTEYTDIKINNNGFYYVTLPITKSPQKIDITIDEYIRYEDIVQPYPFSIRIYDSETNHIYTWGDKLKIGSKVVFKEWTSNLLPEFYKGLFHLNQADGSNIAIELNKEYEVFKGFGFTVIRLNYIGGTNEPKCILSPSRLRIPNSSYKILGYIPDISGHGNHGKINNSAYTEGSGVNADGSYQLDGVDDFISIPTTVGGKQVLMKVNSFKTNNVIYDQRNINNVDSTFCIVSDTSIAYRTGNSGNTYIDGILNQNIVGSDLINTTHNITVTNKYVTAFNSGKPNIGSQMSLEAFGRMSLYDFMLFDEISTDEEILTLNKYVGIEGNTDDLFN